MDGARKLLDIRLTNFYTAAAHPAEDAKRAGPALIRCALSHTNSRLALRVALGLFAIQLPNKRAVLVEWSILVSRCLLGGDPSRDCVVLPHVQALLCPEKVRSD